MGILTQWKQLGRVIDGEGVGDHSGRTVSLSRDGRTVAIGAPYNYGSDEDSGHVRIYQLDASDQWVQVGADIDGEAAFDEFGYSLTLSADGQTVAIGSPYNQGNNGHSGHVRIFGLGTNDQWVQVGADIDGEASGDKSGHTVSLSTDGRTIS